MNSKNEDSATVALPFHYVSSCFCGVMDVGAQAATEACNYPSRPLAAYCGATLHLISYSFIRD